MRLFRRKKGGRYYVEFDRNNQRSLKTSNPREAKRLYHAIRREYLAGRLLDISGDCSKTLGEFYDELEDLGPVDKTQGSHENDLAALRKLIDIAGKTTKLDRINPKHIHGIASAMIRAGRKVGTVNNVIRHARSTFNRPVEWGWLKVNPLAEVKELPAQKTPPNYLAKAEAGRFLAGIQDPEKRRFAAAALATGRRIGELIGLRWEHVDLTRGRYLVVKSKNHLTRAYPINSTFKAVLLAIGPKKKGPVWPRWTDRRNVSRWIKAELVGAGFPNLRAHDLRHSYASIQAMAGRSLQELKELLGHSHISTTLIYTHLAEDHLAQAAEIQLGPIDLGGKTK